MQSMYVRFKNAEQLTNFVNVVDKFDVPARVTWSNGYVDGKSLLGMFSLDPSRVYQLFIYSDNPGYTKKLTAFAAN